MTGRNEIVKDRRMNGEKLGQFKEALWYRYIRVNAPAIRLSALAITVCFPSEAGNDGVQPAIPGQVQSQNLWPTKACRGDRGGEHPNTLE